MDGVGDVVSVSSGCVFLLDGGVSGVSGVLIWVGWCAGGGRLVCWCGWVGVGRLVWVGWCGKCCFDVCWGRLFW